jgi:hypothetical protein
VLNELTFKLSDEELEFLVACFREMLSGASSKEISKIAESDIERAKTICRKLPKESALVLLHRDEWHTIFNVINATIYGLGQFELGTLTGFDVKDALNLNLKIAHRLYGVYDGAKF